MLGTLFPKRLPKILPKKTAWIIAQYEVFLPTLQIWSEAWLSPAWIWGQSLVRD
jgi:hypothetical protein